MYFLLNSGFECAASKILLRSKLIQFHLKSKQHICRIIIKPCIVTEFAKLLALRAHVPLRSYMPSAFVSDVSTCISLFTAYLPLSFIYLCVPLFFKCPYAYVSFSFTSLLANVFSCFMCLRA